MEQRDNRLRCKNGGTVLQDDDSRGPEHLHVLVSMEEVIGYAVFPGRSLPKEHRTCTRVRNRAFYMICCPAQRQTDCRNVGSVQLRQMGSRRHLLYRGGFQRSEHDCREPEPGAGEVVQSGMTRRKTGRDCNRSGAGPREVSGTKAGKEAVNFGRNEHFDIYMLTCQEIAPPAQPNQISRAGGEPQVDLYKSTYKPASRIGIHSPSDRSP